jgi:Cu/Ag efflux pump CusA
VEFGGEFGYLNKASENLQIRIVNVNIFYITIIKLQMFDSSKVRITSLHG